MPYRIEWTEEEVTFLRLIAEGKKHILLPSALVDKLVMHGMMEFRTQGGLPRRTWTPEGRLFLKALSEVN